MSRQFAHAVGADARDSIPMACKRMPRIPWGAILEQTWPVISTLSRERVLRQLDPWRCDLGAGYIDRIRKAFPGKPIVISEYGWCECKPETSVGDTARVGIVNSHTEVLREFPEVAGAIYFDYNDYRTLVRPGPGARRF